MDHLASKHSQESVKQSSKSKKSHNLTVRTDENVSKDPEPDLADVAVELPPEMSETTEK